MARGVADGMVERVVADISNQILNGHMLPGTIVGEQDVAERLGLSRTPVREAIGQLITRGLLVKEQNRSARVRRPTLAELVELYELRIILESTAASLAAGLITEPEKARLVSLEQQLLNSEKDLWLQVHREFHTFIIECAKRPRMAAILDDLRLQSEIYIWYSRLDTGRQSQAPCEHHQLVESITTGDAETAHAVMTKHLQATVDTVSRIARQTNGQLIPLT